MYMNHLLTILAVSSAAIAAPAAEPIKIGANDVLLYSRDGRYQLLKRDDLNLIQNLRQNGTVPPKPCSLEKDLYRGPPPAAANKSTAVSVKASDSSVKLIIPNPPSRFLGWDVQMSAVVKGGPTTLTVTSGYTISNSIGVQASATFGIVKDFLSASVGVSYDQSWSSTQSQGFSGEVPAGKFGVFVSNPWTDRNSGVVFEGQIGTEGSVNSYQADSFQAKGFSGLDWVDGVISLCLGDSLPLNRCIGEGTF